MPAMVSPRKTSSDSSRGRPVVGGVAPASVGFGVVVVWMEVAMLWDDCRTRGKGVQRPDSFFCFNLSPQHQADIYGGMAPLTEFNLDETIAVLTRTPATLDTLLRGLPESWVRNNEGKDTWSAFDIVGHLIVGERTDWMQRARIILENGEARPFDPFDRFAQLKESQNKSLEQLLDDFVRLRRENLAALKALNLQPEDMNRRGRHPALGVVTLSQLLATWAVHDLTHVHQLSRVMAHQYRDA